MKKFHKEITWVSEELQKITEIGRADRLKDVVVNCMLDDLAKTGYSGNVSAEVITSMRVASDGLLVEVSTLHYWNIDKIKPETSDIGIKSKKIDFVFCPYNKNELTLQIATNLF